MNLTSEHVSVVVVGSGFGGSVTAYRMANAGRSVVVLERGRAYPPGSFPRSPAAVAKNFWDPSAGLHGMFDVWSFRGIEAVVSSGLGGGSLIYANVLLRKDEKWFVHEEPFGSGYETWPISRAQLDPHYEAVEQMIGVQEFPRGQRGYEGSGKTDAMELAARRLGLDWALAPLAVTFADNGSPAVPGQKIRDGEYPNLHGRQRSTCTLCGECDLGCNVGAKNTLDHTYLSAAKYAGADLRTGCEVRSFEPDPRGGWLVRYVEHEEGLGPRPTAKLPLREIHTDRLVLAAGTLGTTYLLLRNRSVLPALSPMMGHRFSGNGDLLGFVRDAACDALPQGLGSTRAPVITSAIRVPDRVDGGRGRGYYVEDAGYPGFADWLLEVADTGSMVRRWLAFGAARIKARLVGAPRSEISTALSRALGEGLASKSATPLLAMGRDVPDGVMRLRSGYLDVDWTTATSQDYLDGLTSTMSDLAAAMGGRFVANPLSSIHRVVTVHPLGGAPMGATRETGVVDEWGEVFGHPGLYVADGAAMPGPVGANPSLTIAAFADRMAEHLLEQEQGVDLRSSRKGARA